MEKQSLFREYFPGYMGHIPYKSEVIGMTVGATNNHIKSLLTKEPDYKAQLEPIPDEDYTYYNRRYFTKDISKTISMQVFFSTDKTRCDYFIYSDYFERGLKYFMYYISYNYSIYS